MSKCALHQCYGLKEFGREYLLYFAVFCEFVIVFGVAQSDKIGGELSGPDFPQLWQAVSLSFLEQ